MTLALVKENTPTRDTQALIDQMSRCQRIVDGDETSISKTLEAMKLQYPTGKTSIPDNRENIILAASQILPILKEELKKRGILPLT